MTFKWRLSASQQISTIFFSYYRDIATFSQFFFIFKIFLNLNIGVFNSLHLFSILFKLVFYAFRLIQFR